MNDSSVEKLARVLRVLVVAVFVCSLLALTAVPLLTLVSVRDAVEWGVEGLGYLFGFEPVPEGYLSFTLTYFAAWIVIWIEPVHGVMAIFLWICGICTAVILWQAKRVLDNIIGGTLFCGRKVLTLAALEYRKAWEAAQAAEKPAPDEPVAEAQEPARPAKPARAAWDADSGAHHRFPPERM